MLSTSEIYFNEPEARADHPWSSRHHKHGIPQLRTVIRIETTEYKDRNFHTACFPHVKLLFSNEPYLKYNRKWTSDSEN
jgi:hypothetical protein